MIRNIFNPNRSQRKIQALLSALIIISLFFVGSTAARAQAEPPPRGLTAKGPPTANSGAAYKAGEVLVKIRPGASASAVQSLQASVAVASTESIANGAFEVWAIPSGQEQAAVKRLQADANVVFAELNNQYVTLETTVTPNDPYYVNQWAHPKIGSPTAWDLGTGSASVKIAIIDTGVDYTHAEFSNRVIAGIDYVDGDNDPYDQNGHGTHVAGIAAATGDNSSGVAGVDWAVSIMPVRVLDASGSGYASDVTNGIYFAFQNGAKVINLSLGSQAYNQAMQDAVTAAHAAGTLVVAAMGNYGDQGNPTLYPAAMANVMAVAATDSGDLVAYFSNFGSHCDIAAPGVNIYSTIPGGYDYASGTSMSTPFVTGLAALILAQQSTYTPDQVQSTIQNTALDLGSPGWDPYYGNGRINAGLAMQSVSKPLPPTLQPISNPDGDGSYLVDWDAVPYATSYTLEEAGDLTFSSPTILYQGTNTEFQVTGQSSGQWYYRVRAGNSLGTSAWSAPQYAWVAPGAPTLNPISNPSSSQDYLITWANAAGATRYTLEEDDNALFLTPEVRYAGPQTSYNVTGQNGGVWYYRLQAYNPGGNGPWSSSVSTAVNSLTLQPPNLLPIDNPDNDGNYTVQWSVVLNATGYILEESQSPYFEAPTERYNGVNTQAAIANQAGGTWYYRVRTIFQSGMSPWSGKQSVNISANVYIPQIRTKPFFEGFESGAMPPSGWQHIQSNPSDTWQTVASGQSAEGSHYATVYYDINLATQNEILISPLFTMTSSTQVEFYSMGSLYWCRDTYDNCDLNVWIVIGGWGGGNDMQIFTADPTWQGNYSWAKATVDLFPYIAPGQQVQIAFQYQGQDGAQVGLDAIRLIQ